MNKEVKHIYMIGIGGISMSGIAEILKTWGYEVSGSDRIESNQMCIRDRYGNLWWCHHDLESVCRLQLLFLLQSL